MAADLALSPNDARLERYAELAVRVGANVQKGQTLFVGGMLAHAPLLRAFARAGYAAGARYVDVSYVDQHVRRAKLEFGPDEAIGYTPEWTKERARALEGNASLGTTGDPEPDLLADLPGERVGRDRMTDLAKIQMQFFKDRTLNWSGCAYPNEGWAEKVFGKPDVERLWEAVAFCVRLDEDDPVQAWREHMDRLDRRSQRLNELGLDSIRYRGPGTDLTVGAAVERPLAVREVQDGVGHRVRAEHADRRGLHDAGLPSRGRRRHLDEAARAFR